jgi:hypothetical protein
VKKRGKIIIDFIFGLLGILDDCKRNDWGRGNIVLLREENMGGWSIMIRGGIDMWEGVWCDVGGSECGVWGNR